MGFLVIPKGYKLINVPIGIERCRCCTVVATCHCYGFFLNFRAAFFFFFFFCFNWLFALKLRSHVMRRNSFNVVRSLRQFAVSSPQVDEIDKLLVKFNSIIGHDLGYLQLQTHMGLIGFSCIFINQIEEYGLAVHSSYWNQRVSHISSKMVKPAFYRVIGTMLSGPYEFWANVQGLFISISQAQK